MWSINRVSTRLLRRLSGAIGVASLISGCFQTDVSHYVGDGTICANGKGVAKGYTIELEEFDFSQPFSGTYKLAGCPNIGKPLFFQIRCTAPQRLSDDERKATSGHLAMSLATEDGLKVFASSGSLANWTWGETRNSDGSIEYWIIDANRGGVMTTYLVEKDQSIPPLLFKVDYSPSSNAPSMKAIARVECGGYY